MKQDTAIQIICTLLILLFVYAGVSKLLGYAEFRMQLGRAPFIASYAGIIAWLVPTIELVIVAMLTIMRTRKMGLYASLILMIIFTGYIAGMLLSGTHLPCSCGGVINGLSWGQHLMFNIFFILLSITGIALVKMENKLMTLKIFRANKEASRKPLTE